MLAFVRALALVCAVSTAAAGAGPAPEPATVSFVMPAAGAFVPSGPVVVAGRVPEGAGYVNLILDGAPLTETVRDGSSFSALFTPSAGRHTVEARAGSLTGTLTFTYGGNERGLVPYRYHAPVLEGRCAECHAGMRRRIAKAESETCKSCHRQLTMIFPYLHGPVAAGKCLVCHQPHGSTWPALTLKDARAMCTACHDQPGSLEHVEKARSRVCYLCHNPHASMNRRLLYDIVK